VKSQEKILLAMEEHVAPHYARAVLTHMVEVPGKWVDGPTGFSRR
jgi:hypothetical protein